MSKYEPLFGPGIIDAHSHIAIARGVNEGSHAVTSEVRVGDVLDHYPALLDTFRSFGFHALANPLLRRTVARHTTIETACRLVGVDEQQLVATLNAEREKQAGPRYSLPVLLTN